MTLSIGEKVIINGDPLYDGETGIIREIFRSRGEATVYNLAIEGRKGLLSFYDFEFSRATPRARKTRSDKGQTREAIPCQ